MKHHLFVAALAAALVVTAIEAQSENARSWGEPEAHFTRVSPIELISNAERFDGWNIRVIGLFYSTGREHLLFVSRERYLQFDTTSSVHIDLAGLENFAIEPSELAGLSGKFVLIQGRFSAIPRRQLKPLEVQVGLAAAGRIDEVSFIEERADLVNERPEARSSK